MNDVEVEGLAAQKARALDAYKPSGAMMQHNYLDRQQEVVGVTKDDLDDILGFDGMAAGFSAFGLFFLSGAGWLIAENVFDADGFTMNPLMSFCISCGIFGLLSLIAGLFLHSKKRGRINRIFNQTKLLSANTPSKTG